MDVCYFLINTHRHADSVHAGTLPTETPTLNSTNEQDTTKLAPDQDHYLCLINEQSCPHLMACIETKRHH